MSALAVAGPTVYAATRPLDAEIFSSGIEAFDATTGVASAWRPAMANGEISALAAAGSTIVAGGSFSGVGGVDRRDLAAIDLKTEEITPWQPALAGASTGVQALALSGSTVFLGGDFTRVNGKRRSRIAAVDRVTGATRAWAPSVGGDEFSEVRAIAVSGRDVYFGGDGVPLSSVDASTARKRRGPKWTGEVDALTVVGPTVVVGGEGGAGTYARSTGAAVHEPASVDHLVLAVELVRGVIYAGGNFGQLQGRSRARLGAVNARTGSLLPWSPAPDWNVQVLRACGSTLYIGGIFERIAGRSRAGLAGFDLRTRKLTEWAPSVPHDGIQALVCAGSLVFAGGPGVWAFER